MLFHWRGAEVLREYAPGHIFVEAQSIEEAREIVTRDFEAYLLDRYDWQFHDGKPVNEYASEELEVLRERLREDIASEPKVIEKGVVFVRGSE
jgi:hypothetical protein